MRILIVLLILINWCCAQETKKLNQFILNDTLFLKREIVNGVYHSIFIDTNKNSSFYSVLNNFDLDEFDELSYEQSILEFKHSNIQFKKFNTTEIPSKWVVIKQHVGRLYNYYPSDFYTHFQIQITDSTVILYSGEGPLVHKIERFEKIDSTTFKLRLTGIHSEFEVLIFNLIDEKKGIAIVENKLDQNKSNYWIMVDSNKLNNLPIIVNYCKTSKWTEVNFEVPDYKLLIGK